MPSSRASGDDAALQNGAQHDGRHGNPEKCLDRRIEKRVPDGVAIVGSRPLCATQRRGNRQKLGQNGKDKADHRDNARTDQRSGRKPQPELVAIDFGLSVTSDGAPMGWPLCRAA